MKQKKLSLANIQGKLSRAEMKKIMAGSSAGCSTSTNPCTVGDPCLLSNGVDGWCYSNSGGTSCYCGGAS